ncbi:MAG: TspO/MBR family protein [Candidatus Margulisiibacteriota bacterium]
MIKDVVGISVAALICLLAGVIGSVFTYPAIPVWYAALNKPFFNPPNWIFGPVWTALYIMMGASVYLIWNKRKEGIEATKGLVVFAGQLFLNIIWSVVFFGYKDLFFGLLIIIFLWALILICMVQFGKLSRNAMLLLVPYIVWVSFAAILNAAFWLMN